MLTERVAFMLIYRGGRQRVDGLGYVPPTCQSSCVVGLNPIANNTVGGRDRERGRRDARRTGRRGDGDGGLPLGVVELLGSPNLARSFFRGQGQGTISPVLADRLCVRVLHLHPSALWGRLWWNA